MNAFICKMKQTEKYFHCCGLLLNEVSAMKKRRFSITMKIHILVIVIILAVSFGIAMLAFSINVEQIDRYYKRISFNSAENFATFIDPDFVARLKKTAESDEFQAIRVQAEQTQDESLIENHLRKEGLWEDYSQTRKKMCTYLDNMDDIKYLYIIVLGDSNALYDMYLLDDFDNPIYRTGDYEDREPELMGIDTSDKIEPTITNDKWGYLCCSYAPVYTDDGTLVCHVGCDVDMENILKERQNYIIYMSLCSVGITVIVLFIAIFFTNKFFARPIHKLTEEARKFSPAKNISYEDACVLKMDLKSIDEVSDIYEVLRTTQMNIIDYLNDLSKLEKDNELYMTSLQQAQDDIKDKDELLGKMSAEVYRDALTHVGSKAAYIHKADELSGMITDGTAEFAIAMVDINDLKRINDQFGHKAGDTYIQGCCHIICNVFQHSPVFRIGGDEFVAVLTGADYQKRDTLLKQARAEFSKCYSNKKMPLYQRYSAAVGLAVFKPDDITFEYVFRRADKAMYADKMSFKNKNGSYR